MVKIDLIIVGNSGAGKTCLIKRYLYNEEEGGGVSMKQDPTIGMDLFSKTISVNEQNLKINIWDTAGQDKYFSLTRGLFQKADGVLLTFDLTDLDSFKKVSEYWIQQVIENSDINVKKILIGNKLDMQEERKIKTLEGAELAQKYKMTYFETSAKTGEGVTVSIESLAKQCAFAIQEQKLSVTENQNFLIQPNQPRRMNCFDKIKDISNKLIGIVTFKGSGSNKQQQQKKPKGSSNDEDLKSNNSTSNSGSTSDVVRQQQLQEITKFQQDDEVKKLQPSSPARTSEGK